MVSFRDNPRTRDWELTTPGCWKRLPSAAAPGPVQTSGRLIGGCLETMAMLPGTPFGDVSGFTDRYAPEGLIVYLEVAKSGALAAARLLHHVRLAGWLGLHRVECHGRALLRPPGTGPVVKTNSIYVELAHERKVTTDTGHG